MDADASVGNSRAALQDWSSHACAAQFAMRAAAVGACIVALAATVDMFWPRGASESLFDAQLVCGGLTKPSVGLGTWLSPNDEMEQVVFEALRVGYRHLDCAPRYRETSTSCGIELLWLELQ